MSAVVQHFSATAPSAAGAYSMVATCNSGGCTHGVPTSSPTNRVNPFGLTHPIVFQRLGGNLVLRVCIDPGDELLREPTLRAAAMWNLMLSTTNNCRPEDHPTTSLVREGCATWEETPPPASAFFIESVLLHELGHCALALDHPDRPVDVMDDGVFEETSFSRSWGEALVAGSIAAGPDGVRGSFDDTQSAPMGQVAENVSWFRKLDNDPFVVDSTVIDSTTFARSVTGVLPVGHWATNANRVVGDALGYQDTQAVMYSRINDHMRYRGLGADDVNMLQMARTGEDSIAGTGDDYTMTIEVAASCEDPVDVLVTSVALEPGVVGECQNAAIDYAFTPSNLLLARHFKVVRLEPTFPLIVAVNSDLNWEFGPAASVSADGMEGGNPSGWSAVWP